MTFRNHRSLRSRRALRCIEKYPENVTIFMNTCTKPMTIAETAQLTKGCSDLETISIEVTTHCNSNCPHCFARAGISGYSSLSRDLVKRIIFEAYTVGFRRLHITGGEPLLWKGLDKTIDYAFGLGYEAVFVNTNGILLAEDTANKISGHDGLTFSVSLEGDEMLHDQLRGKGSYVKTVRGIGKLLDAGIELVIFTVARKPLIPQLPRFTDNLFRKFGDIRYLTLIQLFNAADDAFALSEEFLAPDDFLMLVKTVALLNLYGFCVIVKNNPLAGIIAKLLKMPWIPQMPPLYQAGNIIVMANRNMSLSHSCWENLGRYESGMIEKVLVSDAYHQAVAPDKTICPFCKYHNLCKAYGLVRPLEYCRDRQPEVPYCRRVLDRLRP